MSFVIKYRDHESTAGGNGGGAVKQGTYDVRKSVLRLSG